MTKLPPPHAINLKAVAWALLSQAIWAPSLIWTANDWITSKQTDYDFSGIEKTPHQNSLISEKKVLPGSSASSLLATTSSTNSFTGVVLNTATPSDKGLRQVEAVITNNTHPFSTAYSAPTREPFDTSLIARSSIKTDSYLQFNSSAIRSGTDTIRQFFSKADLLGGVLTLKDLNEDQMPSVARAERAQWARSGDPLAPIPSSWRDSMRKALSKLTHYVNTNADNSLGTSNQQVLLDTAKIVHIPSAKVRRSTDVPLALQSDGTVDILNHPDDPQIVEEIRNWSTKQALPSQGRMVPAVVHLHPLVDPERQSTPRAEIFTNSQHNGSSLPLPSEERQATANPIPSPATSTPEPAASVSPVSAASSVTEDQATPSAVASSSQNEASVPAIISTSENADNGALKP